mmetsp:Transcript_30974/g.80989  ORF Transcript_30974/g.80989 Transcript_30974/m.80989 type:complete len:230 (+) Transcript_30974:262-951(+)
MAALLLGSILLMLIAVSRFPAHLIVAAASANRTPRERRAPSALDVCTFVPMLASPLGTPSACFTSLSWSRSSARPSCAATRAATSSASRCASTGAWDRNRTDGTGAATTSASKSSMPVSEPMSSIVIPSTDAIGPSGAAYGWSSPSTEPSSLRRRYSSGSISDSPMAGALRGDAVGGSGGAVAATRVHAQTPPTSSSTKCTSPSGTTFAETSAMVGADGMDDVSALSVS